MTEILWALVVIAACIFLTWLAVGLACALGIVDQCQAITLLI